MAQNNRAVSLRTVSWWAVTADGAQRASSVHRSQLQAIRAAREELLSAGGGELTVLDVNGKVEIQKVVSTKDVGLADVMKKSA